MRWAVLRGCRTGKPISAEAGLTTDIMYSTRHLPLRQPGAYQGMLSRRAPLFCSGRFMKSQGKCAEGKLTAGAHQAW